ncbi:MAG TPA: DUF4150 domain-containing protein [Vicinamibacterales bacterium]|jgi:hypothetical protein
MSVTININNLTLCHKQSGGISTATLPDLCKTPSAGGQPVPYPNIAYSTDLAGGTTTVKADGGNMCANYGSQFVKSIGDEAGTLGGVTSGTFMKEATWITYSFDVTLEGKGACRLTDKLFHNHQNTVNMGGLVQPTLAMAAEVGDVFFLCTLLCQAIEKGTPNQRAVEDVLTALDMGSNGHSPYKPEVPYNMVQSPPAHIPKDWKFPDYLATRFFRGNPARPEPIIQSQRDYGSGNTPGAVRIPDVTILNDPTKPPSGTNIRAVVEMKMPFDSNPFGSAKTDAQIAAYERIANQDGQNPSGEVLQLDAVKCGCVKGVPHLKPVEEPEKKPVPVPEPHPVPVPVPAPEPGGGWLPSPSPGFVQGLSGVGQILGGGALMIGSGLGGAALVADDVTGVGILDDPLVAVAGAGFVGGGAMVVHGAQDLMHAFGL